MAPMLNPQTHALMGVSFGPGSLEGLLLRKRRVHPFQRPSYTEMALIGSYGVYCGNGNTHIADIRTDWVEANVINDDLRTNLEGEPFDDADRVYWLIEMALVDWFDPCEAGAEHRMHSA